MRRRNLVSQRSNRTPQWPSDHPRIAVSIDDFGRASEAPGIRKHGTTVTHVDSRKPIDADRGPDGGKFQRTTEMIKLTGLNRYPTIVGLVKTQPFC